MCRKYDLVDTGKVRAVKRASSLRSWSLTKVYKTRNRLAKSEELYAIRSNNPYSSNQLAYINTNKNKSVLRIILKITCVVVL